MDCAPYDSGDKDSRAVGYRFARRRSRFVWAASRGSVLDGHKSRRLLGQPLVLGIFVKVLSRLLPQLDASPFALPFPQLPNPGVPTSASRPILPAAIARFLRQSPFGWSRPFFFTTPWRSADRI